MKSPLRTLQRIQKFNIDEQRKLLAEQLNAEDKLLNDIKILTEQFEKEKEFARTNTNVGDFGLYTECYLKKRENLETTLISVRQKIEEIRNTITELFKEQKTYEIVDDNRKKIQQKEFETKEQNLLDEIGTNAYIRHKQD